MRRALLLSFEPAHFVELERVARMLARSGTWEARVLFLKSYPDTPSRIETCEAAGIAWRLEPPASETPGAGPRSPSPWASQVQSVVRHFPEPVKQRLRFVRARLGRRATFQALLRATAARVNEILDEERPALLVLPEENVDHLTTVWTKEASKRGIHSVVVPFTVADATEPAEAYAGNPAYTPSALDAFFTRRHPHWVVEHRGERLVRMPVPDARAMEDLAYAPPQPWIMNSGFADAIAVESEAMLAHYRACKLPESQLVMTGALYDDTLAAAAAGAPALRKELGLDARPVFLCALPPDQIATRRSGQCDFTTHTELARIFVETVAANPQVQVVVSLHPRTPAKDFAFLAELGARIAAVDVARLIPMCDLYVASVSATIRMAIACGKPVVNWDVYRYRYADYGGAPGVLTMEGRDEYRAAITRLASEPSALETLTKAQREVMAKWATLDGRAGERMLALFDRLAPS